MGGFRIRIEPIAYFYSAPVSITLRSIPKIERSVNEDLLALRFWFGKDSDPVDTYLYDFNPEKTTAPASVNQEVSVYSEWQVDAVDGCNGEYDFRSKDKRFICGLGSSYQAALLDPASSATPTDVVQLLEPTFSYLVKSPLPYPKRLRTKRAKSVPITPVESNLQIWVFPNMSSHSIVNVSPRVITPVHSNVQISG